VECEWSAWYNRQPPQHDPRLHVTGTCEVASSSVTLRLEPRSDRGADPFVLALLVDRPDAGDTMMATKTVSWADDVGEGIGRVRIEGAGEAIVDVVEAQ
jgi:hypothetical protein